MALSTDGRHLAVAEDAGKEDAIKIRTFALSSPWRNAVPEAFDPLQVQLRELQDRYRRYGEIPQDRIAIWNAAANRNASIAYRLSSRNDGSNSFKKSSMRRRATMASFIRSISIWLSAQEGRKENGWYAQQAACHCGESWNRLEATKPKPTDFDLKHCLDRYVDSNCQ